jgi:hypothetical protein
MIVSAALAVALWSVCSGFVQAEGLRHRESAPVRRAAVTPSVDFSAILGAPGAQVARRGRPLGRASGNDTWLPDWIAAIGKAALGDDPAVRREARQRVMASRKLARQAPAAVNTRHGGGALGGQTVAAAAPSASAGQTMPPSRTADGEEPYWKTGEPAVSIRHIEKPSVLTREPPASSAEIAPPLSVPAPTTEVQPEPPRPLVTGALAVPPPPVPAAVPLPPLAVPAPPPPQPSLPATPPAADADAKGLRAVALDVVRVRRDLPKLELASRVYAERKLSGDVVFQSIPDWVVLEHAHDSMSEADWSAAMASGFEAVTYINDAAKIIVVAIAGTQDLKRDFIANDVWRALIKAEAPQQFYFATQYIKSVKRRYLPAGYAIECVGHSLGGGACAYAAAELAIPASVINPISAGRLETANDGLITNYVVDGDIANLVYGARGNTFSGQVHVIDDATLRETRQRIAERWGRLGGIAVIVQDLRGAIDGHRVDGALDKIARMADVSRPR